MADPAIKVIGQSDTLAAPPTNAPPCFAPRGRTAVQLPTASIISNFDIGLLLQHPTAGSLVWTDFTAPGGMPTTTFKDAVALTGNAQTFAWDGQIYLGTTAIGELVFSHTGAEGNLAAEAQWACPIVVSGGNKWAFGCRIKHLNITDGAGGAFAGLMLGQALAGDLIVDDGASFQTEGSLGFWKIEADGDKYDVYYDETGQSANAHAADWGTIVADTYNTLELYYDGTTIAMYLDGVKTGTSIVATDIAAADFPPAKIFVPTVATKVGTTAAITTTLDWLYAVQMGT